MLFIQIYPPGLPFRTTTPKTCSFSGNPSARGVWFLEMSKKKTRKTRLPLPPHQVVLCLFLRLVLFAFVVFDCSSPTRRSPPLSPPLIPFLLSCFSYTRLRIFVFFVNEI